jgi:hypothetical protein
MLDIPCFDDLQKKDCPFRIFDLEKELYICKFAKVVADLIYNQQFARIPALINRACEWIRKEELYRFNLAKAHEQDTIKMLKSANIGDRLFLISNSEDVILIEKPSEIDILTRCKCKR